jgi:hypothetical protein
LVEVAFGGGFGQRAPVFGFAGALVETAAAFGFAFDFDFCTAGAWHDTTVTAVSTTSMIQSRFNIDPSS